MSPVPKELLELIFTGLTIKEALLSISLVCKKWYQIVRDNDRLWSSYFRNEIGELPDPLPCDLKDKNLVEQLGGDAFVSLPFQEKCRRMITLVKQKYSDKQTILYYVLGHGYLGLARRIFEILPKELRELDVASVFNKIGHPNDGGTNNMINAIRCLEALDALLDGIDSEGGWLHFACKWAHYPLLQFLVKNFCVHPKDRSYRPRLCMDINEAAAGDGYTPIQVLVTVGVTELVVGKNNDKDEAIRACLELLLEYGADPYITNEGNDDAFDLAERRGIPKSVELMRAAKRM